MQEKPNPNQPAPRPSIPWIWWIIAGGLLIWNVIALLPKSKPQLEIPYSSFLTQVNVGNVSSVQISGSTISGKFLSPVPEILPTVAPELRTPGAVSITPATYTDFTTTFPDTEGDSTLLPLLESKKVEIDVTPPPNPLVSALLSSVLPLLLFVLVMWWIMRRSGVNQSSISNIGRSKAREYNLDHPQVTFNDVAGVDEAKLELQEVVDFLRKPEKYHKIGARIPRGVLLVGPPGTGKTLMARAVAGEAGVPFFSISASA